MTSTTLKRTQPLINTAKRPEKTLQNEQRDAFTERHSCQRFSCCSTTTTTSPQRFEPSSYQRWAITQRYQATERRKARGNSRLVLGYQKQRGPDATTLTRQKSIYQRAKRQAALSQCLRYPEYQ